MRHDLATPLALTRLAFGVGTWLAPRAGLALTRLDSTAPQSPYLLRLFAAREAALGLITLLAHDQRQSLLQLGLAVDCFDMVAGFSVLRSRSVGGATMVLNSIAAGSVVIGAVALAQNSRRA